MLKFVHTFEIFGFQTLNFLRFYKNEKFVLLVLFSGKLLKTEVLENLKKKNCSSRSKAMGIKVKKDRYSQFTVKKHLVVFKWIIQHPFCL